MGICRIIQRDKSERVRTVVKNGYTYNIDPYTLPPSDRTLKKLVKILKEQKLKYSISYKEKEIVVKWEKGFFV